MVENVSNKKPNWPPMEPPLQLPDEPNTVPDDEIRPDPRKKKIIEDLEKIFDDLPEGGPSLDILAEVMLNLGAMLRTLQRIATTQAEALSTPTKMQALYTKLMGAYRPYNDTDNKPPGWNNEDSGWDDKNTRWQMISNANQAQSNTIEKLRSQRDMVADGAKQQQSAINTSDDAQKGMLDFLQTLLQKNREWLSAIFR